MRKRKAQRLKALAETKTWHAHGVALAQRYETVEVCTLNVHEINLTERKARKAEREEGAPDYLPIDGEHLLAYANHALEKQTARLARKQAEDEAKPAPFERTGPAPSPSEIIAKLDAQIAILDKKLGYKFGPSMAKIVARWQVTRERLLVKRGELLRIYEPDSEIEELEAAKVRAA